MQYLFSRTNSNNPRNIHFTGLVAGILGALSVLTGIYFSYKTYGVNARVITTTITLAITILFLLSYFDRKLGKSITAYCHRQ